jgi:hypothetical protein
MSGSWLRVKKWHDARCEGLRYGWHWVKTGQLGVARSSEIKRYELRMPSCMKLAQIKLVKRVQNGWMDVRKELKMPCYAESKQKLIKIQKFVLLKNLILFQIAISYQVSVWLHKKFQHISCLHTFKKVYNEKWGGSGRWQMLRCGLGPWQSTFFSPLEQYPSIAVVWDHNL